MSQESSILEDDNSIAPENITALQNQQETNWPDAPTIQIPGVSSTTSDQPPEVTYNRCQVQPSTVDLKIPELEDDSVVIQEDRHCMPTSDYYFTNIQPDPIIIPPYTGNNSSSTPQQVAAKDQIPQETNTLKPGETRVYPSMLAEKNVLVIDLTNSTITSEADLQTAFHSLNLCSTEKEDPSHGRKQSSTEEDTH